MTPTPSATRRARPWTSLAASSRRSTSILVACDVVGARPAVTTVSGGLDSVTPAHVLANDGHDLVCLSFDYG
jgi:hypothetical protein